MVGLQGIEPCPHAPEARILPVYYSPLSFNWSGCRELNPGRMHPMHVYYRYITARNLKSFADYLANDFNII